MEDIINLIAHQIDASTEDIKPDTNLRDLIDSLDYIEIIMMLEDRYNITIPDEELNHISTARDLDEYINSVLGQVGEVG